MARNPVKAFHASTVTFIVIVILLKALMCSTKTPMKKKVFKVLSAAMLVSGLFMLVCTVKAAKHIQGAKERLVLVSVFLAVASSSAHVLTSNSKLSMQVFGGVSLVSVLVSSKVLKNFPTVADAKAVAEDAKAAAKAAANY